MNPLSSIKSALQILKQKSDKTVNESNAMRNRYGETTAMNYTMAGGKPVSQAQAVQNFLQKRNLPGQVITGALAKRSANDPVTIARAKMASGQNITDQEKRLVDQAGMSMVAGVTSPLKSDLTPGTRAFQDLRNDIFQLRLKNNQNFMNKGQIDLEGLGSVEELAQKYLSKQAMNLVKRNNGPGARTSAFLDELEVLTQ